MISENNFGYFNGAIGNLFYLITVNETQKVNVIIDILLERCTTDQYLFYTEINDSYVDGMNFGLNHGHLSIIKTLLDFSINDAKSLQIIEKCIKNIILNLDYEYQVENVNIYKPYNAFEEGNSLKKHQNDRICWCNSDLSFSYILYIAGKKLNDVDYLKLANMIGKETTKRKVIINTGIGNHHFCHGSSGVAQLYQELFLLSSKKHYKNTHKYWIERTISYLEIEKNDSLTNKDLSLLYGKLGSLMVINDKIDKKKYLNFLI
jgi:hypothetical protein